MREYLVYITQGGLMEDPEFHDEDSLFLFAENVDDAVTNWAKIKGYSNPSYLHRDSSGGWTYWGWKIHVRAI